MDSAKKSSKEKSSEVNKQRLLKTFLELVEVDSLSFRERKMADLITSRLRALGLWVTEDDTCHVTGSDAGNLFVRFYEKGREAEPAVLFSAHMDTVAPGTGKKALVGKDGRIRSDGKTVLGADDASAMAAILEAVTEIKEEGLSHRNIELLFPVAEEAYTVGSEAFDMGLSKAETAYFLDREGEVGSVTVSEPTLLTFTVKIKGKASHAGFAPEKGISAIVIAAKAIAQLPVGRADQDTTLAVGTIQGGVATNVVPEYATVRGEIRSRDDGKAFAVLGQVQDTFEKQAKRLGGSCEVSCKKHLTAYRVKEDSKALSEYRRILKQLDIPFLPEDSFGGSDCNTFKRRGIDAVCIANAMWKIHTTEEYTDIEELARVTQIVKALMKG